MTFALMSGEGVSQNLLYIVAYAPSVPDSFYRRSGELAAVIRELAADYLTNAGCERMWRVDRALVGTSLTAAGSALRRARVGRSGWHARHWEVC